MREVGDIDPHSEGGCSPVGAAIADLAARQHGVVSRAQLRELGLTAKTVESWVRRRWLHPIHSGVYAVGHPKLSGDGRLMAAVLACGPRAVVSHRSAAHVWGIRPSASRRIEVTVPRGRRGVRSVTVYRSRNLLPQDVALVDGFPVTSVARTLLDLASVVREDELARAIERAESHGLFDLLAVEEICERGRGRRGAGTLRRLLARWRDPPFSRSDFERLFHGRCGERGIPLPSLNVVVEGLEVDAYWQADGLVVELDSWEFHRTRAAFERDRERDARLVAAGLRVMRFTWRQLQGEESWARLTRALRRR